MKTEQKVPKKVENNIFNSFSLLKFFLVYLVIGFGVYYISLFGQFIWDDEYQIIYTPDTYSLYNIPNIFLKGQLGIYYKPVFFAYLTIIHSIFGLNAFAFHFFQVLIHVINSLLIFLIFSKFINRKISFFLTLIFLVHPMNVESISYISASGDPLSLLFGLLAFHFIARHRVTVFSFFLAAISILFSLLAKESGLLILLIILMYRFIFIKRSIIVNILFFVIPLFFYFFLRFYIAHTFFIKLNFIPISLASPLDRLITVPKIFFFYVSTFFLPIKLSIAQHWVVRSFTWKDFFIPLFFDIIFFVIIISILITVYKRKLSSFSALLFFLFWFIICMGLYFQIFPIDMTVAERWFYLPMVGLLGFIGLVIQLLNVEVKKLKKVFWIGILSILLLLSIKTVERNTNWASPYTLFSHDILITKDSFDLELNYSYQMTKRGEYDKAAIHAEKAIMLAPNFTAAWATAGNVYLRKKEYKKASNYYMKALQYDNGNYAAFYGLIHSDLLIGDNMSARGWSIRALRYFPKDVYFLGMQAIAEYNLGNRIKAQELARQSFEYYPIEFNRNVYLNVLKGQQLNYNHYIPYN